MKLIGQRFDSWVVVEAAPRRGKHYFWLCRCDCGQTGVVRQDGLVRGESRNCGCKRNKESRQRMIRHGFYKSSEYRIWAGMIARCTNPKTDNYSRYGGRGITVCDEWRSDFMAFLHDVGPRPSRSYSLDRIDNNRGYEKSNCRWATAAEQYGNRRKRRTKQEAHG